MKLISIVVPAYNEEKNLPLLLEEIKKVFSTLTSYSFELIFVNDGSQDKTQETIDQLSSEYPNVKSIEFSRNFGKEAATSAGLHFSSGDAVIVVDADLQHPVDLIPNFINKWEQGFDVVIGLRTKNPHTSFFKKITSSIYYNIINIISSTPIVRGATDFRLLDKKVVTEFCKFSEHERITRGLIDWLGYKRAFVEFTANERAHGVASYSYLKLLKLAISSSVSHSLFPLKFAGYLGLFIITTSGVGGTIIFIERYVYKDILGWHISGSGQLAVLMIFFIGIVLSCLGLIALYIGNIMHEVYARPLYIVRKTNIKK